MDGLKGKISIFLPNLKGGGAEKSMTILANSFFEEGYQVDLILAKKTGPFLDLLKPGINCFDLNSNSVLKTILRLVNYIRDYSPQVLLTAINYVNITAILAKIISRKNFRLVISERNNNFSRKIRLTDGLKPFIVNILVRFLYPFADSIIAVSKELALLVKKNIIFNKNKVIYIYNPIILNTYNLKSKFFISEPYIIAIGRLEKQKNFPLLINAYNRLRNHTNSKLLILGEGSKRDELEELIAKLGLSQKIIMPGFEVNIRPYLEKAKMLVLSSNFEGLPTVLIEGLIAGTPIVSTNCPTGPNEILEGGKWGRLVKPNDEDSLYRGMLETLEDMNPPNGKNRAKEFNVENAVKAYLKVMFPCK